MLLGERRRSKVLPHASCPTLVTPLTLSMALLHVVCRRFDLKVVPERGGKAGREAWRNVAQRSAIFAAAWAPDADSPPPGPLQPAPHSGAASSTLPSGTGSLGRERKEEWASIGECKCSMPRGAAVDIGSPDALPRTWSPRHEPWPAAADWRPALPLRQLLTWRRSSNSGPLSLKLGQTRADVRQ